MEVSAMFDEPQAANHLIGLSDGAIADLGGGTTGAALFKDSQTILSFDEPTGGHHLSLVIAGRFKIALEQAENIKLDPKRSREVASIVAPVLSKMGTILKRGFKNLPIPILWLVGGSSAAPGATQIISQETGLLVESLTRPELVTPAGIALGCPPFEAKALEK
jgi:ethanolamine utilization protein EutJ